MQFLHSMIRVKDEIESKRFYCEILGLKEDRRIQLNDCCLQYLCDENTGFEIELTINDEIPKQGYTNGSSFGHFAFSCDNLDEIDKKIKQFGYKWDVEPFYMKEVNTRIAFLLDPDGNSVELIENSN